MTCDPDWNAVVLLLPFDGTNGQSTGVPDLSPENNTMTLNGSVATLTTSSPLYGTASLNPGTVNAIGNSWCQTGVYASGSPMDLFAQNQWTVEGAMMLTAPGDGTNPCIVVTWGDFGPSVIISVTPAGDGLTGTWRLFNNEAFGGLITSGSTSATVPMVVGTWYKFALVNISGGSGATLYVGGAAVINLPTGSSLSYDPVNYAYFGSPVVSIGSSSSISFVRVACQIDEVRATANIARYTTNYTPDIAAFPPVSCTVTVPDVLGDTDAAAQAAIIAATLTVGIITTIVGGIPGTVFSQSPIGGAIVAGGTPVDLVEYAGAIVPNVVNTSATLVAPGIITAAGFVLGSVTYAPDVLTIAGNVSSQSPSAGALVAGGTPVNIVVSTGRAGLLVPLILFLTEAQAIDSLVSIGLVPGAISFAPSTTFAAGEVMAQNPSAGNPVAYGSIVGFVVSTGTPIVSDLFDTTPTVISQYANSPTLLQWISNMNLYLDQSVNFAQFLAYVWNVNTAVGFGLNILGRIVNVSRLLQIPNTTPYVGFDNGTRSPSDWEPLGSNLPGGGGIGALYSGHNATQAYLLDDDAYRQLILAKAFANICSTTAASINRILQNLYGDNNAWVLNTGTMSISYNFRFRPSPIQLAILQQSGVIPTPPGVAVTIVSP